MIGWLAVAAVTAQTSTPEVQISVTDISCTGRTDGEMELTLISGTLPVDFQWVNQNTGTLGIGQFTVHNQPVLLPNLAPGLYQFQFAAADGVDTVIQRMVVEPLPLQGELVLASNAAGYHVTCALGMDGAVLLDIKGGTAPLTYQWSNGDQGVRQTVCPPDR